MIPVRAPAGNFPDPVIHPFTASEGTFSTPAAVQTDSIEIKKNLAYRVAHFGVYPSRRILLAVLLQKLPIIV